MPHRRNRPLDSQFDVLSLERESNSDRIRFRSRKCLNQLQRRHVILPLSICGLILDRGEQVSLLIGDGELTRI